MAGLGFIFSGIMVNTIYMETALQEGNVKC